MAAAAEAFRAWREDEEIRRSCLRRAAEVMAGASDLIGPLLTAEQGKPLRIAGGEAQVAAVAQRLECGTSLVNAHSELGPDQPLVGAMWSGIGAENGQWGLEGMTQLQVRCSARA
jgi:acyl-CoA reductase-like NAD-dependent aldehyde dehydrogenase